MPAACHMHLAGMSVPQPCVWVNPDFSRPAASLQLKAFHPESSEHLIEVERNSSPGTGNPGGSRAVLRRGGRQACWRCVGETGGAAAAREGRRCCGVLHVASCARQPALVLLQTPPPTSRPRPSRMDCVSSSLVCSWLLLQPHPTAAVPGHGTFRKVTEGE